MGVIPRRGEAALFFCLCISALFNPGAVARGASLPEGFNKLVEVSFNTSFLEANLTDFPVLVKLTPERIDYGELTGQNGLCFYDARTGMELPWECEQFEPGGVSYYWVKVPNIEAGSGDASIWLYYGGDTTEERAAEVWGPHYRGVWHLKPDVDNPSAIPDSTSNGNHGQAKGGKPVEGRIGPGRRFSGEDYIEVPHDDSLNIEGELSLEAWVYLDEPPETCMGILEKKESYHLSAIYYEATSAPFSGPQFRFRVFEPDRKYPHGDHYVWHTGDPRLDSGQWLYLVGTKDKHGVLRTYVNGRVVGVRDVGAFRTRLKPDPLYIGFLKLWDCHFEGALDEVRASDRAYSADWIRAQYLAGQGLFARIGSENSPATHEFTNPKIGVPVQTKAGEFKLEPCPRVEKFFGLGFYGVCPSRWTTSNEKLTMIRYMDRQARNWMNLFFPAGQRFRDAMWRHKYDVEEEPEGFDRAQCWIDILKDEWAPLLKKYGMYYLANAQGFAGTRSPPYPELNIEERERQMAEIVSALKDDDNLLGWYIEDEPGDGLLPNYLTVKKMLETGDRDRLALCLFAGTKAVVTFAPYQQVMITDRYWISRGAYYPWGILTHMLTVGSITDAPHWITLFGAWLPEHAAFKKTPAELRLTSWLAIAGGAKSIQYYIYHTGPYFRWGPEEGVFVDAYGNISPHMEEYRKFAEKILPVGKLLVDARVDEHTGIAADTPQIQIHYSTGPNDYREWVPAVYVGVLKLEGSDSYLLIPVNQDLEQTRPINIKVRASLREDKQLYDLVSLQEVPCTDNSYSCRTLAPGDGWPYILCSREQFSRAEKVVLKTRAEQALRVARLDIEKAGRWNIKDEKWDKLVEQTREGITAGQYSSAIETAQNVSSQVERRLQAEPVYTESADAVEGLRKLFGELQIRLNQLRAQEQLGDDKIRQAIALSERFSHLSGALFLGQGDGLADRALKLREEVERFASAFPEVKMPQPPESVEERVQLRIESWRERHDKK